MKNTVYMLAPVNGVQMNSFIITTADGKVIVIDGGFRCDAEKLISRLKEITGNNTPHIDAWFLSHAHCDHIDAFMEIIEKHPDELSFDRVYYNFPSVKYFEAYENHEAHTVAEFYALLPRFADKACIVSQYDSYVIGEAKIELLYSPDPDFTHNAVNNSSIVFRLTLGKKTVIFLGDLGVEGGRKLLRLHGERLKSDYCQMAHHGQNGVGRGFYEAAAPKACLWSTPDWLWNNDAGGGYNTHSWKTVEVRGWMEELGVRHHFVNKDGTQVIILPYGF